MSHFVRRDGEGRILFDSRLAQGLPEAAWIDCLPPHSVENVGERDVHLVSFELKLGA